MSMKGKSCLIPLLINMLRNRHDDSMFTYAKDYSIIEYKDGNAVHPKSSTR